MSLNQLLLGDNLEILRSIESESVDLVYLDPPFFSNRTYEVIWGDKGEVRSFEDRFSGGIDHYIAWLKDRVQEMHRVLKPTGSIFLHCDWHADAYIRVNILDRIFGYPNFRNEITWQRTNAHNDARKKMPNLRDSIFYYAKSSEHIYTPVYIPLSEDYLKDFYHHKDDKGWYMQDNLTAPNIRHGESGKPWKGFDPTTKGRSWAVPNQIVIELVGKEKCEQMGVLAKLDLLNAEGYIVFSNTGTPRVKRYADKSKGITVGDVWADVSAISSQAKERIGYPTQKPVALLERIIKMASNEGDVVLDPFVGGGTTVAVADKLNRRWIGIDQSVQAVKVTEMRLYNQADLFSQPFITKLHKYDYDTLRFKDAFAFETFIVTAYGGRTNTRQRGDLGLDGHMPDNTPIQVKRSDNIGRNVIDNFLSAVQRYDKRLFDQHRDAHTPVGYVIAFSFGKGAIEEVARLKNSENVVIQLVRVEDVVPIAKKPTLHVAVTDGGKDRNGGPAKGLHSISFQATGESAVGVEFYSWDFDYKDTGTAGGSFKAEILLDKVGAQTWKFKPGLHHVAVKVVDNDGLESVEVLKLKVNGKVEVQP